MVNCLICGKPVDDENWLTLTTRTVDKAIWEGKTYWFCGHQHKQKFINNREVWLAQEQVKSEG